MESKALGRQSPQRQNASSLCITRTLATSLLGLYDYPHPLKPGLIIKGYDKPHAFRTAQMCTIVATELGHPQQRIKNYQIACLLHDLGRAGLDKRLFGKIWSWAKQHQIPTRPREWRARHPRTPYGRETAAFLRLYKNDLIRQGIAIDYWTREQIEMRLGFSRRLRKQLIRVKPQLNKLGIRWKSWMELVMLYYYYPEKLGQAPSWVRQLGEILVACEQLEAYSNNRRGRDYYARSRETFSEAFEYLAGLHAQGVIGQDVWNGIRRLTARGTFDHILSAARGHSLSAHDRRYLQSLYSE